MRGDRTIRFIEEDSAYEPRAHQSTSSKRVGISRNSACALCQSRMPDRVPACCRCTEPHTVLSRILPSSHHEILALHREIVTAQQCGDLVDRRCKHQESKKQRATRKSNSASTRLIYRHAHDAKCTLAHRSANTIPYQYPPLTARRRVASRGCVAV